ncbi:hypothetical protein U1Q18_013834 [Sarracenia purpurea var. burkii]
MEHNPSTNFGEKSPNPNNGLCGEISKADVGEKLSKTKFSPLMTAKHIGPKNSNATFESSIPKSDKSTPLSIHRDRDMIGCVDILGKNYSPSLGETPSNQ